MLLNAASLMNINNIKNILLHIIIDLENPNQSKTSLYAIVIWNSKNGQSQFFPTIYKMRNAIDL